MYTVDSVVLFDRQVSPNCLYSTQLISSSNVCPQNLNDFITGGTLTFSDGTQVTVPTLINNGTGLPVKFTARNTTSVMFTVTSAASTSSNVGLDEFQVFYSG